MLSGIMLLDGCCLYLSLSCFAATIEMDSSFALIGSIVGSLTAATVVTEFHQSSSKQQQVQVDVLTVGYSIAIITAIARSAHCSDIAKCLIT